MSIDGRVGSAADVEVCESRRDRRAFTDEPGRNTCLDGFGEYRAKKERGTDVERDPGWMIMHDGCRYGLVMAVRSIVS